MCPPPRAAMPSASRRASTIGARRLTSSARSISSTENESIVPAAGQRRRWRPARRPRRPRRAAARRRPRSARSHAHRAAAGLGRERLEHLGPPRRSARAAAPRAASARAIACPRPPGGAGRRQHVRAPGRASVHGKTATVAVKPCRNDSPPTGPISPAAKKPAAGAPASASATVSASWSAVGEQVAAAAVAGEHAARPPGVRPPSAAMRTPSASRRSRSALVGVAGVQAHDLAGVDVGGHGDVAGRRVGADEPAHEEVARHVVGLVGVDHDAHQQPALDELELVRGQRPRSSRAASRAPAGPPARRSRCPRRR